MNTLNQEIISFYNSRMGGLTHAARCCIRYEWTKGRQNRFTLDSDEESKRCEALADEWVNAVCDNNGIPFVFYRWYKKEVAYTR